MAAPPAAGQFSLPTEAEDHIREIADGASFRKAPAIRALLLYLCEHSGESLSEYAIATAALGRKADFNPKTDATVRVHIARLRQKLREYYEHEGAVSPIRITIPLGRHEIEIESAEAVDRSETTPAPSRRRWRALLVVGATVALAAAAGALFVQNRRLTEAAHGTAKASELPAFWRSFFANGLPTALVLPTPVFFEWNTSDLKVRDRFVNRFEDFHSSSELRPFVKRLGPPTLMQNYVVTSDAFAALKLAQFLAGKDVSVGALATGDLSIESFEQRNLILLGLPATNFHIARLMEKANFYSIVGESRAIRNRRPLPGESDQYVEAIHSPTRRTVPGLVMLLPGGVNGTRMLMITGKATAPLVSFLISSPTLDQMDAIWRKSGAPPYFELVLEAELDGNTVLKVMPKVLRPVG